MIDLLFSQEGYYLYVLIAGMLIGGSIGLPIPEELPLIVSGVLLHKAKIQVDITFIVCYVSVIISDILIYKAGNFFGPRVFEFKLIKCWINDKKIRKIKTQLTRHAFWMIFVSRHLFYLKTATFLCCGAFRVKFLRFLAADMLAAMISIPIMMSIGYFASEHVDQVLYYFKKFKSFSLITLFIVVMGSILFYRYHRKDRTIKDTSSPR